MTRSPIEWLEWYEEHGDSRDLELSEDETVLYHPEHGLVAFRYYEDILEVHHMVGDGKYWFGVLKEVAKMHELKTLRAKTTRDPRAWMRKYGGHIIGYYMESEIDEIRV